MANFKSYWSAIKPYSAIVGLYALLLTALKLVEYFAVGLDAPNKLQLLGNAILYNCQIPLAVAMMLVQLHHRAVEYAIFSHLSSVLEIHHNHGCNQRLYSAQIQTPKQKSL